MPAVQKRRRTIRFELASPSALRLGILTATLAFFVVGSPVAVAGPGESDFAAATTSLRSQSGLPAFRVCSDLTAVAQSWAAHMAANDTLAHNPNYSSQIANWSKVGENVGKGPTAAGIQTGLVGSPAHLENLVSQQFTEVGYGTAISANGNLYLDEVFRNPESGPCSGAPAAVPAPIVSATPKPTVSAPAVHQPAPDPTIDPVPPAPVVPNLALAVQRLSQPTVPPADEDSIGRAFNFHQTFAQAVQP